MSQQGPNAVNLRWEAVQKRKEWKKEDAAMTMKQDALSYCETHDVFVPEGDYCPISETTGEECEFAATMPKDWLKEQAWDIGWDERA